MEKICDRAKDRAEHFLSDEIEYQMSFLSAEKRNPITMKLSDKFDQSIKDGVSCLIDCDIATVEALRTAINSEKYDILLNEIYNTIISGGKLYLSGCGSSGRLCMRAEASWRAAAVSAAPEYIDSVVSVMTGGDYALVHPVENFEDYISLGRYQIKKMGFSSRDMVIGVTATSETTSVLGSAIGAIDKGGRVWMLVCTEPEPVMERLSRVKEVFGNKLTSYIYIPCGAMAVTGSTRMQSSTLEQIVLCSALNDTLCRITDEKNNIDYVDSYEKILLELKSEKVISSICDEIELEEKIYREGNYITYFADEYMLDILTDTAERSPTFNTPAFKPSSDTSSPMSWEYVKNPTCDTRTAWQKVLLREVRCIEWNDDDYAVCGITPEMRTRSIDREALFAYSIGNEPDQQREGAKNAAVYAGLDSVPDAFYSAAEGYGIKRIIIRHGLLSIPETDMKIFEHIAMKLIMNDISTGTMARLGRIQSNFMINLRISNKKLVDRAARIISELCNIEYPDALYELYYSVEDMQRLGIDESPVKYTLDRIKGDIKNEI